MHWAKSDFGCRNKNSAGAEIAIAYHPSFPFSFRRRRPHLVREKITISANASVLGLFGAPRGLLRAFPVDKKRKLLVFAAWGSVVLPGASVKDPSWSQLSLELRMKQRIVSASLPFEEFTGNPHCAGQLCLR